MTRPRISAAKAAVCLLAGLSALPAMARDYGQHGKVFPVIEVDLLRAIEERLRALEASGRMEEINREFAARTAARVRRPPPVAGIARATATRSWTFDPSMTVEQDIRDHRGRVLFARGTRVNPLETVAMARSLVFLDGDDPEQVRWALRSTTAENAHLVLVRGDVFDAMKAAQRRFYFDQGGLLTTRFGIRHVPAVVQQEGKALRVTELGPDRLRAPERRAAS